MAVGRNAARGRNHRAIEALEARRLWAAVSGTVFNDADGDGVRDAGEAPLAGATVEITRDVGTNGGSVVVTGNPMLAIPDGGKASKSFAMTNRFGHITALRVLVQFTHANPADLDIVLVTPGGGRIGLMADRDLGGGATTFARRFATDATQAWPAGAAAPAGNADLIAEGDLASVIGMDPNGVWKVEFSDDAAGNAGSIGAMSIEFEFTPPRAITDGQGNYSFAGLAAGAYTTRVLTQSDVLDHEVLDVRAVYPATRESSLDADETADHSFGAILLGSVSGAGNDRLLGGAGRDLLDGDEGKDTWVDKDRDTKRVQLP